MMRNDVMMGGMSMEKDIDKDIAGAELGFRKIAGVIKQNGRKILQNYPISSTQFIALQWVTDEGDLTIGELSKKIGLAFSTTTDLVDRMEENEIVKRVRDSKDRRIVRIHVLDEGKSIIKEVIKKRQEYLGEVLEGFSIEEVAVLNEYLLLLHTQMKIVDDK